MKKILALSLVAIMLAPITMSAQNNKTLEKALKKEYKAKIKEYKKEGWKIFATSHTLEVALLTHYDKLTKLGENGQEIVGTATAKTDNLLYQSAVNNASNIYARNAGSHIKGRIISDMGNNANDMAAEFDHFYAAYETLVEKEIRGELQQSYSIYKEVGNGVKEIRVYFIVNEDAASKARIKAYETALKESEAAQKYAEKVSEFVREGFNVE